MMKLTASLSAPNPLSLLHAVSTIEAFASTPPVKLEVDDDEPSQLASWAAEIGRAKIDGCAYWENRKKQVEIRPKSDLVTFSIPEGFSSPQQAMNILEPLPFEIGALKSPFFEQWMKADYSTWGFSRSHLSHGWACIFRGAGHDRLVSRRWLDFGPWRVLRRPNDTTVIQFHDLAITDPLEAYEQAKVGHERMGNSPTGGYLGWYLDGLLEGASTRLYNQATRTLERVVPPGDVIPQSEMLCNAALRLHHRLTRPTATPVDHVAYVFTDLDDARAHLHELWLREMEVWFFDGGKKHRLDLDYHPVPNPPDWALRLDAR